MSESTAKKWLVISALSVFGIWWYRRWREGPAVVLEAPKFIAAWGTVYFLLSLVTEAAPGLGGSFSMLVMVGDLLGNAMPKKGGGLLADVKGQQAGKAAAGSAVGGWDSASSTASTGVLGSVAQGVTAATTPGPPGTSGPAGALGGTDSVPADNPRYRITLPQTNGSPNPPGTPAHGGTF